MLVLLTLQIAAHPILVLHCMAINLIGAWALSKATVFEIVRRNVFYIGAAIILAVPFWAFQFRWRQRNSWTRRYTHDPLAKFSTAFAAFQSTKLYYRWRVDIRRCLFAVTEPAEGSVLEVRSIHQFFKQTRAIGFGVRGFHRATDGVPSWHHNPDPIDGSGPIPVAAHVCFGFSGTAILVELRPAVREFFAEGYCSTGGDEHVCDLCTQLLHKACPKPLFPVPPRNMYTQWIMLAPIGCGVTKNLRLAGFGKPLDDAKSLNVL